MNAVTVEVPATTSNLGPGYDCLGIALGLANRVTITRADPSPPPLPMAHEAAAAFFARAGVAPFAFTCEIGGDVPVSRGLGSSVTLRMGTVVGLNTLAGEPLSREEIFWLCAGLEGHPDNAAPAMFGGFTVAGGEEGDAPFRFQVSEALEFVLLIPDFEVRTADSRRILPEDVSRRAAVASSGRACRITAAFAARNYEALRGGFEDSAFHQPHRLTLVPFLNKVLAAGQAAGALGGFLSGSGSTIACLTLTDSETVARAMFDTAASPGARTVITRADNLGTRIVPSV